MLVTHVEFPHNMLFEVSVVLWRCYTAMHFRYATDAFEYKWKSEGQCSLQWFCPCNQLVGVSFHTMPSPTHMPKKLSGKKHFLCPLSAYSYAPCSNQLCILNCSQMPQVCCFMYVPHLVSLKHCKSCPHY